MVARLAASGAVVSASTRPGRRARLLPGTLWGHRGVFSCSAGAPEGTRRVRLVRGEGRGVST